MSAPRIVRDRHLDIWIVFHDTPQLWCAYKDPEGRHGTGKTPTNAVADLIEQMDEAGEFDSELYCGCGAELKSEAEKRNRVCRACL